MGCLTLRIPTPRNEILTLGLGSGQTVLKAL